MTKIAFAARYADDTPYGHGRLTIRLVDGGSGAALPNGLGVTPRTVNLDADGEAIVDLTPNADISDPVGTFYAVTVNDSTPTVVRYIEVPAPNGSGNSEIPYDWDDDTIQRLVPEPPSSIPAATQGEVGQVLGVVNNGDGKKYELVDQTGGASTDTELTVEATAATFKNATVVAAYEEAAGLLGVDPSIAAGTAAFLPSLITENGSTQDELSDNASNAARLAMALADRGRTDAAAAQADADQALAAGDLTASLSQVVGTTYLKVGHGGGVDHDEGAFACDTDLQFPDGLDIRVWGRLIRSAGADSYAEWVTRNVDGLVGSVDGYELALWEDEDGDLRWFAEHIKVGETVELNPRPISAKGLPQNPAFGLISGIRHTIDYTGGPGGVGVEKLWVPSGDPDEVTADGVGWRIITELVHEDPESMNLGYTEPFMLGMSEHESHLFVVQMFNGIDGTCLVDLHASDATSATEITCRQGTTWTAAGSQGEIVGYAQAGTDASALTTGTVPFARLPIGTTSTTVPAGNDARFSDARTPTAHKTSHATGGSDAIAPSDIGAVPTSYLDTDGTLAANSDTKVPTQKASKLYIDRRIAVHRGAIAAGKRISSFGAFNTATATGMGGLGDRAYGVIWLPAGSYSTIWIRTTAAGNSTWRLGLCAGSSSDPTVPGAAVVDAGTVNVNATPGDLSATASFTITTDGFYFPVAQVETYTAAPTLVVATGTEQVDAIPFLGWPGQQSNYLRTFMGYYDNSPTAAAAIGTANALTGNASTGLDYAQAVPRFWVS